MKWYDKYLKQGGSLSPLETFVGWKNEYHLFHNTAGPAIICCDGHHEWWIMGIDITSQVNDWIKENNYPAWQSDESWDDNIKLHFKMRFNDVV